MMRVKICGLNSEAAVDAAVEAGADWLGFVFFARSPRAVTPARAATLSARHLGGPERVGLFVSATDDEIALALDAMPLDVLQLYDRAERIEAIRARFGLPVWRAVGVSAASDLPAEAGADALLVEAKAPPGADRPGGNAVALDWSLLTGWRPEFPWVLGGGLTPETVSQAIALSGATAVDVSSGVERAPGEKDTGRIAAFVRAAKEGSEFFF